MSTKFTSHLLKDKPWFKFGVIALVLVDNPSILESLVKVELCERRAIVWGPSQRFLGLASSTLSHYLN